MSSYFKPLIASGVAVAHLVAMGWMVGVTASKKDSHSWPSSVPAIETYIYMAQPDLDEVPIPEMQLHRVTPAIDGIQMVRFEDSDAGDISGVIASTSGPQLSRAQIAEVDPYARRAGLSVGRPETTVLVLEVLSDGTVGAVSVSHSSGNTAADAAAMDYARLLRWTPGTVDHRAQTMRISFPVTLAVRAQGR